MVFHPVVTLTAIQHDLQVGKSHRYQSVSNVIDPKLFATSLRACFRSSVKWAGHVPTGSHEKTKLTQSVH